MVYGKSIDSLYGATMALLISEKLVSNQNCIVRKFTDLNDAMLGDVVGAYVVHKGEKIPFYIVVQDDSIEFKFFTIYGADWKFHIREEFGNKMYSNIAYVEDNVSHSVIKIRDIIDFAIPNILQVI